MKKRCNNAKKKKVYLANSVSLSFSIFASCDINVAIFALSSGHKSLTRAPLIIDVDDEEDVCEAEAEAEAEEEEKEEEEEDDFAGVDWGGGKDRDAAEGDADKDVEDDDREEDEGKWELNNAANMANESCLSCRCEACCDWDTVDKGVDRGVFDKGVGVVVETDNEEEDNDDDEEEEADDDDLVDLFDLFDDGVTPDEWRGGLPFGFGGLWLVKLVKPGTFCHWPGAGVSFFFVVVILFFDGVGVGVGVDIDGVGVTLISERDCFVSVIFLSEY